MSSGSPPASAPAPDVPLRTLLLPTLASGALAGSLAVTALGCLLASADMLVLLPGALGLVGAVIGAGLGVARLVIARLDARLRISIWLAAGTLTGWHFARGVGAFQKIHGPHARLAVLAIAISVGAGVLAGLLFNWIQLDERGRSRLSEARSRVRWMLCSMLVLASVVFLLYENSEHWLSSYPAARNGLVGAAWVQGTLALLLTWEPAARRRSAVVLGVIWSLLVMVEARRLDTDRQALERVTRKSQAQRAVMFLRAITDIDRDGFSSEFGGGDCAPFDPKVNPLAREVAGNGIDDNCRYGDAKSRPKTNPVAATGSAPTPGGELRSIVLITIDALRADHTTPYGYERNTTPALAEFAESATRFDAAYTSGGWTCLALPSLFAGVYPRRLSYERAALTARQRILPLPWQKYIEPGDEFKTTLTLPVQDGRWTLQAALSRHGLHTAAVFSNYLQHLGPRFGDGWDTLEFPPFDERQLPETRTDHDVTELALQRLTKLAPQPFFLWVHYFDAHDPQTAHEGIPNFGPSLIDKYDHEVAAVDHEVSRLLAAIDGLERPPIVIIAADHGEAFEWGFQFHGTDLLEDTLHIPLLMRVPGLAPGVVKPPVSLVDIAPTLLTLSGLPIPEGLDGIDLFKVPADRRVVTDLFRFDTDDKLYLDQVAVSDRRYHLVFDRLEQRTILASNTDLKRPPKEIDPERAPRALTDSLAAYLEEGFGAP